MNFQSCLPGLSVELWQSWLATSCLPKCHVPYLTVWIILLYQPSSRVQCSAVQCSSPHLTLATPRLLVGLLVKLRGFMYSRPWGQEPTGARFTSLLN
jgi:hypothetical protein